MWQAEQGKDEQSCEDFRGLGFQRLNFFEGIMRREGKGGNGNNAEQGVHEKNPARVRILLGCA